MDGIEEVLYLVPDRVSKRPATSLCVTSYHSSFLWMLVVFCLLIVNVHGNICIAERSYAPYRISNCCISTYSNYCSFNAVYGVFFIMSLTLFGFIMKTPFSSHLARVKGKAAVRLCKLDIWKACDP